MQNCSINNLYDDQDNKTQLHFTLEEGQFNKKKIKSETLKNQMNLSFRKFNGYI